KHFFKACWTTLCDANTPDSLEDEELSPGLAPSPDIDENDDASPCIPPKLAEPAAGARLKREEGFCGGCEDEVLLGKEDTACSSPAAIEPFEAEGLGCAL